MKTNSLDDMLALFCEMSAAKAQSGKPSANGKRRAKVKLVCLSLNEIHPSPENELFYKPVDADDPEIQALAKSIQRYGLQEPLVVTRDRYILSGHRRYAACKLLGMREVSCEVRDIERCDPEFEILLREYNRQRVKSLDETLRETVVDFNPEDAYHSLIEHRKAASAVTGEFIQIEGVKTRKRISTAKRPMLDTAIRIVFEQREYWPLSDRSIHYDFLNVPPLRHTGKPNSRYRNNRESYNYLCDLLTRARLVGHIPFDAIADPTRTFATWYLYRSPEPFFKRKLDGFLTDYRRDYQQSQPNYIEIVGEKNTIEGSIRDVAMNHGIPYTLGRGYCSIEPRYRMAERFKKSGKAKLIVLVLSDFDPEGEDIAHSFARSMRDDFGVEEIHARKVCLTYEQVVKRDLPQTFGIKKKSSRYPEFAAKYGDRAHELEALPSAERSELLEEAIKDVLDIDAFNAELDAEKEDCTRIETIRQKLRPILMKAIGESEGEASY
jgi:hypothetical protein